MTARLRASTGIAEVVAAPRQKQPRLALPRPEDVVRFPADMPPRLLVIVDAEEEFDWNHFVRSATAVTNVRHQVLAHEILDRWKVAPTYTVDYAVASQADGVAPLAELLADGRCEIGAQLHSWVTPPFEETVSVQTSYACNLPRSLEFAKIERLTETIADSFGVRPTIYRAGRYGLGPNSMDALLRFGYQIDCSILPWVNLNTRGGPDFSEFGVDPFWVDPRRSLLELPVSVGMTGMLDWMGVAEFLYPYLSSPSARSLHIPGILSRLRLLDRIPISPEGTSLEEAKLVTRWMLGQGHRVFAVSYHSSSLGIGVGPYVQNKADLSAFLGWLDGYLEFFFSEIGGQPARPGEIRSLAQAATSG